LINCAYFFVIFLSWSTIFCMNLIYLTLILFANTFSSHILHTIKGILGSTVSFSPFHFSILSLQNFPNPSNWLLWKYSILILSMNDLHPSPIIFLNFMKWLFWFWKYLLNLIASKYYANSNLSISDESVDLLDFKRSGIENLIIKLKIIFIIIFRMFSFWFRCWINTLIIFYWPY